MYQESISYEEIRETKLKEYGTELNKWIWILIKQYKDRTHFIFELLQNAEDAGATKVKLILEHDKLIIEHDGHPFTKKDVVSITRIADSSKNKAETSIGRFGIGFKSVYTYTTRPRIYSGKYCFEIRNFVYPYEIESLSIPEDLTRIEIPFDNAEIPASKAFAEINKALNEQVGTDSILFLNNIEELTICVAGNHRDITIIKEANEHPKGDGFIFDINLYYQSAHIPKNEKYLLFTDCEKEPVKIAFKIDNNEIVPVKSPKVYTFFPTDKESHQAFLIHAPFVTTPARDNIVEDNERNHGFINSICDGLVMAFCWMRDFGYLTLSVLNSVYPTYSYPNDSLFRVIYDRAVELICSDERLIPTNQAGVYKSVHEVAFPENMTIVDCFPDDDIHFLFTKLNLYWIDKDICRDAYQELKNFLNINTDIKTYSWKEILSSLTDRFLERKQKSWFVMLFNAIRSFAVTNARIGAKHDVDISRIPFVRLTDGIHITAFHNGSPCVYLNNPRICPNKIDAAFLQDETIYDFYAVNLRIPDYNIERIVCDTILPKYKNRGNITVSLDENIADLKSIENALNENRFLLSTVAEYYILTDGTEWYRPYELHIPSGFRGTIIPEYKLLGGILDLKYITSNYEKHFDTGFFQALGCANGLMQKKIDLKTFFGYAKTYLDKNSQDELARKIIGKKYQKGIHWDVIYEGFPEILKNPDREKSLSIARFLNNNIANIDIQGEIIAADDQSFNGKNVETLFTYSSIGMQICYTPWLYTKKGDCITPVSIHRRELDEQYERISRKLLDKLPFKEEDKATEEILSRYSNSQEREFLKKILTDNSILTKVAQALADQERRERERQNRKTKTPTDILNGIKDPGPIKGQTKEFDTNDDPGALKNPERYRDNIQKEFEESLDHFTNVSNTRLHFTFENNTTAEEKHFLLTEYKGYCQICQTRILKKDGEPHFNAINVMNTSTLAKQYTDRTDLGWNSLCLCPNCAAKYRYGRKDLSRFSEQVSNITIAPGVEEYIYISIQLQGEDVEIRYTPKHFAALQAALITYREKE